MRTTKRTICRSAFVLLTALVVTFSMVPIGLIVIAATSADDIVYLTDLVTAVTSNATGDNTLLTNLATPVYGKHASAFKPLNGTGGVPLVTVQDLADDLANILATNVAEIFDETHTFADLAGIQLIQSKFNGTFGQNNFQITINPDYNPTDDSIVLMYIGYPNTLLDDGEIIARKFTESNDNSLVGNQKTNSLTSQPSSSNAYVYYAVLYFSTPQMSSPSYIVEIPPAVSFGGPGEGNRIKSISRSEITAASGGTGTSVNDLAYAVRYVEASFAVKCTEWLDMDAGSTVSVAIHSGTDFTLVETTTADTMPYKLYNDAFNPAVNLTDGLMAVGDTFTTFTGEATVIGTALLDRADILVAGNFTDTMYFSITYSPAP